MRFPKTGLTHIVFERLNVSDIRKLVDMEFLGGFMLGRIQRCIDSEQNIIFHKCQHSPSLVALV